MTFLSGVAIPSANDQHAAARAARRITPGKPNR
jgi:hypothetical protein